MPEEAITAFDPAKPLPTEGGCYVRNEDGSLSPDPNEPAAPEAPGE